MTIIVLKHDFLHKEGTNGDGHHMPQKKRYWKSSVPLVIYIEFVSDINTAQTVYWLYFLVLSHGVVFIGVVKKERYALNMCEDILKNGVTNCILLFLVSKNNFK